MVLRPGEPAGHRGQQHLVAGARDVRRRKGAVQRQDGEVELGPLAEAVADGEAYDAGVVVAHADGAAPRAEDLQPLSPITIRSRSWTVSALATSRATADSRTTWAVARRRASSAAASARSCPAAADAAVSVMSLPVATR